MGRDVIGRASLCLNVVIGKGSFMSGSSAEMDVFEWWWSLLYSLSLEVFILRKWRTDIVLQLHIQSEEFHVEQSAINFKTVSSEDEIVNRSLLPKVSCVSWTWLKFKLKSLSLSQTHTHKAPNISGFRGSLEINSSISFGYFMFLNGPIHKRLDGD